MPIETSVAIMAGAVVVLVIFLVTTLLKTQKTLEATQRDIHHLSTEAIQLMTKIEALTTDIKSKADSLNFMFMPLKAINRELPHRGKNDTVQELVNWLSMSLILFHKLKVAVKHYAK